MSNGSNYKIDSGYSKGSSNNNKFNSDKRDREKDKDKDNQYLKL